MYITLSHPLLSLYTFHFVYHTLNINKFSYVKCVVCLCENKERKKLTPVSYMIYSCILFFPESAAKGFFQGPCS